MGLTVSVLSRYGRLGASSRLRMMQFDPALRARGIEPAFRPLFPDHYLERLYGGGSRLGPTLGAYARRLGDLARAGGADVIWLEKEALPWVPAALERALLPRRVPLVADYDDAVFHRYDRHRRAVVRRLLGRKIDRVMAASALVMAGNRYLADRARAAGARRVEIVPTVVEAARYAPAPGRPARERPVIGWIGSPSTWAEYMVPMLPLLTEVAARTGARLRVVGSGAAPDLHPLVDVLPWTEADEVLRIHEMDVGIMPLDDSPWARGKCGYKLIQYMAAGLPVIATPVGVNAEIVEDGVSGFLVRDAKEWRHALETLLGDAGLRARMGAAGRRRVETHYSAEVWGPRIAALLHDVATGG